MFQVHLRSFPTGDKVQNIYEPTPTPHYFQSGMKYYRSHCKLETLIIKERSDADEVFGVAARANNPLPVVAEEDLVVVVFMDTVYFLNFSDQSFYLFSESLGQLQHNYVTSKPCHCQTSPTATVSNSRPSG